MKKISNAAGTFLTGSAIADAIMEYATALWNQRRIALVDIPFVNARGAVERAQFHIGWANQVTSVSTHAGGAELTEPATERRLRANAETVGLIQARPLESPDFSAIDAFDL